MLNNLTEKTPRKTTLLWLILTALYTMCIIINDHYDLIQALHFGERTASIIKMVGVFGYVFSTLANFNQKPKDGTSTQ